MEMKKRKTLINQWVSKGDYSLINRLNQKKYKSDSVLLEEMFVS